MFNEAGSCSAAELAAPTSGLAAWWRWKPADWRAAVLLTLLVVLQLAGAIVMPLDATDKSQFWDYVALGALGNLVAAPTLLAMWTVFGPKRAAARLPVTFWLMGAFALCVAAGVARTMGEYDVVGLFLISASVLIAFFTVQLPLWGLRAARRWRFALVAGQSNPSQTKPSGQFTLRDLLGWTLAAASLFAAARWMLGDRVVGLELTEIGDYFDVTVVPLLMIGGSMSLLIALAGLPIVALAWILLAGGRRPVLRIVLSVLTLTGTPGGVWLCARFIEFDGVIAVCIEAGAIAIGIVNLGVLWACGYRLSRRQRSNAVVHPAEERSFGKPETALGNSRQAPAQVPIGGRRFAISLATLLVIAAGLAWSVPFRLETWRQAAIHADWERSDVNVSFDESGKLTGLEYSQAAPVSDDTLQRIAQLNDLESLNLARSAIDDRQLALLAPLAGRLRELTLSGTNITDVGLKELSRFHQLDFLNLTNTGVTDAGLAHLKSLAVLRTLHLSLTDVTDSALPTLASLPNLQILDVELTAVSETAAAKFEQDNPNIMVDFGASDGELLRALAGFDYKVEFHTPIGPSIGISRQAPNAKHLHARGRGVTDMSMATICSFMELEDLDLRDSAVSDAGLTALTKLPNLRRLDLRGSAVTEGGVARLATALPDCKIVR